MKQIQSLVEKMLCLPASLLLFFLGSDLVLALGGSFEYLFR